MRSQERRLSQVILEETTTLGVRVHARWSIGTKAGREMREVQTPHGIVRVKLKFLGNSPISAPCTEYDDCKTLADQTHLPVRQIWDAATTAAQQLLADLRLGK